VADHIENSGTGSSPQFAKDRAVTGLLQVESRIESSPSGRTAALAAAMLWATLYVRLVGFQAFQPRNSELLIGNASGGTAVQIAAFSLIAIVGAVLIAQVGLSVVRLLPFAFLALLAWCLISAGWALDPVASLRRSLVVSVPAALLLIAAQTLGSQRSFSIISVALGLVIILDWLAIALVPYSVHLSNDYSEDLIGAWRGYHLHKNDAGEIMAGCLLFFVASSLLRPSVAKLSLIGLSAVFLVNTNSKTSISLVAALISAMLLHFAWQRFRMLRPLILITVIPSVLLAAIALVDFQAVENYMVSPMAFTGRGQVWRGVLEYVSDHWVLGAGFASFWGIGADSPILRYAESWAAHTGNGHNGYLDMLAATGVVGFVLSIWAFVLWPIVAIWRARRIRPDLALIAAPLFGFAALHDLLESSIMGFVPGAWSFWLIATAIMLPLQKESGSEPASEGG
jgi:exopolysaccharide production protein ExoQ